MHKTSSPSPGIWGSSAPRATPTTWASTWATTRWPMPRTPGRMRALTRSARTRIWWGITRWAASRPAVRRLRPEAGPAGRHRRGGFPVKLPAFGRSADSASLPHRKLLRISRPLRQRQRPGIAMIPGLSRWQMRDSNPRRRCQLIYSQPPLAARVICRERLPKWKQDNFTELIAKNRIGPCAPEFCGHFCTNNGARGVHVADLALPEPVGCRNCAGVLYGRWA